MTPLELTLLTLTLFFWALNLIHFNVDGKGFLIISSLAIIAYLAGRRSWKNGSK